MEFHRWETSFNILRNYEILDRDQDRAKFAVTMMATALAQFQGGSAEPARTRGANAFNMYHMEQVWCAINRPYYNIYPAVVPLLTKLKLSIPASAIKPNRYCAINLRLPRNRDLGLNATFPPNSGSAYPLRSVMLVSQGILDEAFTNYNNPEKLAKLSQPASVDSTIDTRGFSIWMDFGEADDRLRPMRHVPHMLLGKKWQAKFAGQQADQQHPKYVMPIYSYQNTILVDDRPDSDSLTLEGRLADVKNEHSSDEGLQIPQDVLHRIVRLCVSVWLIDEDPDILEPDVLAKHRDRYQAILAELEKHGELDPDHPLVQKLIASRNKIIQQAAARRGEAGWDLGKKYEPKQHGAQNGTANGTAIPSLIPPHPCLFWTGHGRSIPKIRTRRGHLRNRELAESVPTGFDGPSSDP